MTLPTTLPLVVPAHAGTHTPCRLNWARGQTASAVTSAGGYGSLLSQGRREERIRADHKHLTLPAAAYWVARSSRAMTAEYDAADYASTCRPRARGDPYAVSSQLGTRADGFRSNERRWLWVPAFAGTTGGENSRRSQTSHPPRRGVLGRPRAAERRGGGEWRSLCS